MAKRKYTRPTEPAPNLNTLAPAGLTELVHLKTLLADAILDLDKLKEAGTLDPTLHGIRNDLLDAFSSAQKVREWSVELLDLIKRLTAQRQAADRAFETGWEARYIEIVSRLSSGEYAHLRAALERYAGDDGISFNL